MLFNEFVVVCRAPVCFPEFGIILDLADGDVCTFDTSKLWHCCMQVPMELSDGIILSLYYKRDQHLAFWEEKCALDVEEV